jgi:hypothetical protein
MPLWHCEQGNIPSEKGGAVTNNFLDTSGPTDSEEENGSRRIREKTIPKPDTVNDFMLSSPVSIGIFLNSNIIQSALQQKISKKKKR